MANRNDITKSPLRFNDQDLAVAAQRRVNFAGADDAAYDLAIVALENAPATSPAGVQVLFDLYKLRVESLMAGDDVSPEIMVTLERNIAEGLARLARKAG